MRKTKKAAENITGKQLEEELKKFSKELEDLAPYMKKKAQRVHSTTPQWETTNADIHQEN